MNFFRILTIAAATCALLGCRGVGTQQFVAFAPDQPAKLESASPNVVDVRCKVSEVRADYNLWENLHMLAPMPNRTKFDVNLEVERVVKGEARNPIYVHWLRSPTESQCRTLRIQS